MDTALPATERFSARLRRQISSVPVSLFGATSAVGGLGLDWRLAGQRFGFPSWVSAALIWIAVITIAALTCAYVAKSFFAPGAIRAEFQHPVVGSLFGLLPLSLLSLSGSLAGISPNVALAIWISGASSMIMFTWFMVARWMSAQQPAELAHPAWIVPAGGIANVPLAIPALHLTGLDEVSVLSLAVGLFLTIPIFTLILNRLMYHAPLPKPLRPALMILTAPFSIGYSAYLTITGSNDLFAQSLFMIGVFLSAVFLFLLVHLPLCCPFRISWWSIAFPLAASTSAALRFAERSPGVFGQIIALAFLALSTAVIVWLFCRTLVGIAVGELETLNM